MPKAQEGESTRGGIARDGDYSPSHNPPLVRGFWEPLQIFFLILSASMCDFNGVLCVWDQISVVLVTKVFLVA